MVNESGEGWRDLGRVWLSDGKESGGATLQYRVRFSDERWNG